MTRLAHGYSCSTARHLPAQAMDNGHEEGEEGGRSELRPKVPRSGRGSQRASLANTHARRRAGYTIGRDYCGRPWDGALWALMHGHGCCEVSWSVHTTGTTMPAKRFNIQYICFVR